jgi:DNA-binding response OmpR family regulator
MSAMAGTRVLLLEDDDRLRTSLRLVLELDGYDVLEAADAETALDIVRTSEVEAIFADLMLGGIDGFSFIRSARPRTDVPIIVLSARDAPTDVVMALQAGADDYVRKPFDVEEVKARLRAALRRPTMGEDGTDARPGAEGDGQVLDSTNGPLVFDAAAAVLRRGAEAVNLTRTEFLLLRALSENAGRVLSRELLLHRVWGEGHVGDERIVDVQVRRLRLKVEVDPTSPELVVTVRGLGYRLDVR